MSFLQGAARRIDSLAYVIRHRVSINMGITRRIKTLRNHLLRWWMNAHGTEFAFGVP